MFLAKEFLENEEAPEQKVAHDGSGDSDSARFTVASSTSAARSSATALSASVLRPRVPSGGGAVTIGSGSARDSEGKQEDATSAARMQKMLEQKERALAKKSVRANSGMVRTNDGDEEATKGSGDGAGKGGEDTITLPSPGSDSRQRSSDLVPSDGVVVPIMSPAGPSGQSATERDLMAMGITPVFDPVKQSTPEVRLDLSDMRGFLLSPVPTGAVVRCYITRDKTGIKNKLFPSYDMFLDEGERFLLASKKRTQNRTSNYVISMDRSGVTKESAGYLGKLRSNFMGTEFTIFDKGVNPKNVDEEARSISLMTVRQELGFVAYEPNVLGNRGPRKMTVAIPAVSKEGQRTIWRPIQESDGISARVKSGDFGNLVRLENKTPKWNDQMGAFVLNFYGRVTMASVKNFQLVTPDDANNIVLQFGRVTKDRFNMDVRAPMSPLQAFAVCLSSFDNKIACE